jgi:hypothetical protein
MGFEDRILGNIDRRRQNRLELSPVLERGYEKAVRVLNTPEYSIQESEFAPDIYTQEAVDRDLAHVKKLEGYFAENDTPESINSKKVADVLEALVLTQSEMSNWLGDAKTLRSSRFDDYVNKVDMIAEWHSPEEGSRVLGLAVDVTFGFSAVQKKLREIRAEIDSGKLGSIRYFKDERGDIMGTRNNVPRTVIGVSQPVVQELARLWIEGEKKLLGEHPVQRAFIDQVTTQLRQMQRYAESRGKHDVAFAYKTALATVAPIEEQKKQEVQLGALVADPVYAEIASQLQQQFKA